MRLEEIKEKLDKLIKEYRTTALLMLYGSDDEVIPVSDALFFKTIEFPSMERNVLDFNDSICVFSNEKKDLEFRIPLTEMGKIAELKKENNAIFGTEPYKIAQLTRFAEELLKFDENATKGKGATRMKRIDMDAVNATATTINNGKEFYLGNNYSIFAVDISKIKDKEREKYFSSAARKAEREVQGDGINKLTKKAFEREIRKNAGGREMTD